MASKDSSRKNPNTIVLPAKEFQDFSEVLTNPPEPNEKFKKLMGEQQLPSGFTIREVTNEELEEVLNDPNFVHPQVGD